MILKSRAYDLELVCWFAKYHCLFPQFSMSHLFIILEVEAVSNFTLSQMIGQIHVIPGLIQELLYQFISSLVSSSNQ